MPFAKFVHNLRGVTTSVGVIVPVICERNSQLVVSPVESCEARSPVGDVIVPPVLNPTTALSSVCIVLD